MAECTDSRSIYDPGHRKPRAATRDSLRVMLPDEGSVYRSPFILWRRCRVAATTAKTRTTTMTQTGTVEGNPNYRDGASFTSLASTANSRVSSLQKTEPVDGRN